jgi:amino acid adenylation domain-containing protein
LLGGVYVAPRTAEEALMARVWQEALGVAQVGLKDNYFNLGGDSLMAIGLIANINKQLATTLTIADLYSHQTVEDLASAVTALKSNNAYTKAVEDAREELRLFQEAYQRDGRFLEDYESVYPMNGVEKGMVFENLKSNTKSIHDIIYHEQNMYDYPCKNFDFAVFEQAVALMVEKHPALRKVYDLEYFAHITKKNIEAEVNFIDISDLGKEEQKAFIQRKMLDEKMRMTNLSFSVLWRINMIKVRSDFQYMLFDFNHSLFDGWSLSSFLTELFTLYPELVKNRHFIPTRLQSTYEDQIIGELAAAGNETSLQFWKEEMSGYTRFELPSTGAEHEFISDVFEFGLDFRAELEQLAVKHHTSFKHLCFAAFIYTLNMLSYEDDITVGVVTNNRPLTADGDRLLGCFLNTVPFRAKIPGSITWGGYIEFIENKLRQLKYHEKVPFYKILETTGERSGEQNPIFDVAFNYLDFKIFQEWKTYEDTSVDFEEHSLSEFFLNEHFPFGFHIEAHQMRREHGSYYNKSFRLLIRYSTAIFGKEEVKRLSVYFKAILDQFLYNETGLISKETIMAAEKRDYALLKEFNATQTAYDNNATVLDEFSKQVQLHPDKTAVVFDDTKLTYKELNDLSNQLAHMLLEKGVGNDTLVPICIDRSLEMIIGIMGILKAGGAYVPIDPTYPQNRIDYIIADTKPTIVLTERNYQHLFTDVVCLPLDDRSVYTVSEKSPVNVNIPTRALAYVIYTSGTTGTPKGVMNQHDGIYNRLLWMRDYLGVTETDVILQKTTFCFDVSVWELLLPLITGAKLVFAMPEGHRDPEYLWKLICAEDVSLLHFVPSMLSSFLSFFTTPGHCDLRAVVCSGEELKAHMVKDFQTLFPAVRLYNLYGPTEAAIDVTAVDLTTYSEGAVTIGKPTANVQIHIVDHKNSIQPIRALGEVLIGGIQVARGYVNKAELTAQKFIDNPFDKEDTYRLYKTGDIGRWLPDGNIELLGRVDDQVKIRGFRIELGEIQNQVVTHPEISDSVVLAVQKNGNTYLAAYYVSKTKLDTSALQHHVRQVLPDYMVPAFWIWLEQLPLTSNGKIDKKALPDPDVSGLSNREYVAPRNKTEQQLAAIWKELLGIERVGIYNNFFDLGGHSLLVTRLVSLIRRTFEVELAIRDVFEYNTIATLAAYIAQQSYGLHIPAITVAENKGQFMPLSYGQERLWFIDKLQGSEAYHIPTIFRLSGAVDATIFEKSFRALVERHEVFRMVISEKDGIGYQQLIASEDWSLQQVAVVTKSELHELLSAHTLRPFDFSKEYMLRACLYRCAEDDGYYLSFVVHHIASDGWSSPILIEDLVKLYNAYKRGVEAALPPLRLQYSDYAIWQRKYVTGDYLELQLQYWEQKLNGYTTLSLPTDYSRPPVRSMEGAILNVALDQELSAGLKQFCQEQGVTLYMLMLSVYNVLLYRYSQQDDIMIGTPIANRTQEELEDIVGFFVNTLVIRTQLSPEMRFTDLLQRVKETALEAYDHQNVPFEKIVDRVVKERDMSISPLFQIMFTLQNTPEVEKGLQLEGVQEEVYEQEVPTARFDLSLTVAEANGLISYSFNYSTDLFARATMERMALHYEQLLHSVVQDRHTAIAELQMLTTEEADQLVYGYNNTAVAYPKDKTIIDLFEAQAAKTPDAIAVVFGNQELTYQSLDERSNQLARYLQAQGVKQESLVPICMERGPEMIVAILGILKAGGAYVPIDPQYPVDRIAYMLQDADAQVLITDSHINEETGISQLSVANGMTLIMMDRDWPLIADGSTDKLVTTRYPNHLAYVIYTSGSTGRPKGVMVEHRSLVNFFFNQQAYFNITADERILQFSNYVFDASIEQIVLALMTGASLIVFERSLLLKEDGIRELLIRHQVTHLHCTPGFLQTIALDDTYVLKRVVTGGEVCPPELAERWAKKYPFYNKYGPTETTVTSVEYHIQATDLSNTTAIPIGRPISNTQVYIVNADGQLCPVGVGGELCIGGAGLARGYLNRDELTAERFVANPFRPGERMYKTGDVAHWLSDGNIAYTGRIDDQVKIRGYRIELGEIESVLQSHESVSQAVVLAKADASGNKRLVAYVVMDGVYDKTVLQDYLKQHLPEYMVPALWAPLEALPLTPNGKTDKKALPDPDVLELSSNEYVAPRNKTEQQLAAIWMELLGIERVGAHDNFFELGGHSLLATRLVSLIRRTLEVELAIRDVFEYNTIATLAAYIAQQSYGLQIPAATVVEDKGQFMPLSYGQERLWFIDKLQGSEAYHIPNILRVAGEVDAIIFEKSLRALVQRHEVLRMVIKEKDGAGYQQLIPSEDWSLQQVVVATKSELHELLSAHTLRPFDFSKDYMLRACLYQCAEDGGYYLSFVVHHIASDGWSSPILIEDLVKLYNGYKHGIEADLPPLRLQYSDYAIWQRKYVTGNYLELQLQYWEQKLNGYATLNLPADYSRPPVRRAEGSIFNFVLNQELNKALKQFCQEQGVTLYMLLLSVYNVLLYRYSQQDDIVVGTPIANRTQEELEDIVGFFINTLVMRTQLSPEMRFTDLLQRVKETALEAYDHQNVPFEKIVDRVVKERDMSISPLFQIMFTLQNAPEVEKGLQIEGIQAEFYEQEVEAAQFDLSLTIAEANGLVNCSLYYSTNLFARATMERMALHYERLLQSVVQDRHTAITELQMLTTEEADQLIYGYNDTAVAYPKDKTIIDLFEAQAVKTPDAIAVVFGNQKLTYQSLDERSNQLARYLQAQGVKQESLVPICMERGPEMIVAILGILKAGGAYVPIDPECPTERIQAVLEDTRSPMLLAPGETIERLSFLKDQTIQIIDIALRHQEIGVFSNQKPPRELSPDNLIHVLYTSGSTGIPKGVMIEHQSMVNVIYHQKDAYKITEAEKIVQIANYCSDAFAAQLYLSLLTGSVLIIPSKEVVANPEQMGVFLQEQGVTHLHTTPGYLAMLNIDRKRSLKRIIAGGELVSGALAERWNNDIPFYNNYESTETSGVSIEFNNADVYPIRQHSLIGKPISNTRVYIINALQELCPIGVAGEICISGAGLARGYVNNQALTDERFVKNPFVPGERMFRTGDWGRRLPGGTIAFVGRKEDQVKIKGYGLAIAGIEVALSSIETVKACCVLAKEDKEGNKRLVGYVVAAGQFDKSLVESRLKEKLPDYMVPKLWITLEQLPLTSTGKIDKKALPDPDLLGLSSNQYVAPRNKTEAELAHIWQELLQVDQVGVYDNFFDLGGRSLLVISLINLVEEKMSQVISIPTIFEYPVLSALSDHIIGLAADVSLYDKHIIEFNASGEKPPIFILPGIQGLGESYFELAKSLGTDQPVYGINMYGRFHDENPLTNIDAITDAMITWIKKVQPVGPYILIGHSMGGAIAYEILCKLSVTESIAENQLFLIDSTRLSPSTDNETTFYLDTLEILLNTLYQNESIAHKMEVKNKIYDELKRTKVLLSFQELRPLLVTERMPANFLEITNAERVYNLIKANLGLSHNHTVDITCKKVLILSEHKKEDYSLNKETPFTIWSAHLGNLEVDFSSGNHDSMVAGDNAMILAAKIKNLMEHA